MSEQVNRIEHNFKLTKSGIQYIIRTQVLIALQGVFFFAAAASIPPDPRCLVERDSIGSLRHIVGYWQPLFHLEKTWRM